MMKRIFIYALGCMLFMSSCEKLVKVDGPSNAVSGSTVYNSDNTAASVLTVIYAQLSSQSVYTDGPLSTAFYMGMYSDELVLWEGVTDDKRRYYRNDLNNTTFPSFWDGYYSRMYVVNAAIEGISASESLTPAIKDQLLGEAKFLRAFYYFYLANLYGDVPLALSADYRVNAILARSPRAKVYEQIVADLKDAQLLMSGNYLSGDAKSPAAERVRPNKWVATALLARVYLYTKEYALAEAEATKLIENPLFELPALDDVFLSTSKEAIWHLQPVWRNWNTDEARLYYIQETGFTYDRCVYLSSRMMNAFEPGDGRRAHWTGSRELSGATYYYAYKYKVWSPDQPITEYSNVFRLAEQYLIRSEARLYLANIGGAQDDLNEIRHRAGLDDYKGPVDETSFTNAILQERRVEFFTEWGHRWFDLVRTERADAVMTDVAGEKGGNWESYKKLFPVRGEELLRSVNIKQTEGYQ